jgi:hypothetical protein
VSPVGSLQLIEKGRGTKLVLVQTTRNDLFTVTEGFGSCDEMNPSFNTFTQCCEQQKSFKKWKMVSIQP